MSRWVRGIYNAAANFVLSGSLRAASGRTMDRDTEQLREECNQSNQHEQSYQSSKSHQSGQHACSCHPSRICNCAAGECADDDGSQCVASSAKDGKLHGDNCTCSLCRDYRDYISSTGSGTIRTEGQGAGSRIRFSDESRSTKRSDNTARTDIEHITGIPTGVTL